MPSVELVMIVRNEARCLARCLASVRPWVDTMLVVDTGSTDDTPRLARDAGARVEAFAWIDDFAAARNHALGLSDADWRVVLDADEWVERGGESLAALRSQPADHLGLVRIASRVAGDGGAEQLAPSWLPRVLPRGVRFEGRIHEQPVGALPRRRLPLVLGHDGYLPGVMQGKAGRNEALLRRALAEQPGDAYLRYQLGKDLEVRGAFAAARPLYEQAWAEAPPTAAWRHDLLVRLLFTLKKLQAFDVAVPLAQSQIELWPGSPDFFFVLGDLLLDWALAEPARGTELLPMIESCWLRAIEIGEQPELPDTVTGRGSFLAAQNLAAYYESLGRPDQAAQWRERSRAWRTDA